MKKIMHIRRGTGQQILSRECSEARLEERSANHTKLSGDGRQTGDSLFLWLEMYAKDKEALCFSTCKEEE